MLGRVIISGTLSDPSEIKNGVKQGCVLAPLLFIIFYSFVIRETVTSCTDGVYIRFRTDGKLFNLSRLRAKSKVKMGRNFGSAGKLRLVQKNNCIRQVDGIADSTTIAHNFAKHFEQICQPHTTTLNENKKAQLTQGLRATAVRVYRHLGCLKLISKLHH